MGGCGRIFDHGGGVEGVDLWVEMEAGMGVVGCCGRVLSEIDIVPMCAGGDGGGEG